MNASRALLWVRLVAFALDYLVTSVYLVVLGAISVLLSRRLWTSLPLALR